MPPEAYERFVQPHEDYASIFAAGLLDPHSPTPSLLAGPHGKSAVKRYNVYRNNVTVSLIEALAAVFPATLRITGADFFRAMARFYVRLHPPVSPLLFDYGRDFPEFIADYDYARSMPWLSDVAQIERAWLDAYHAADAEALTPADLAAIRPERLEEVALTAHPAARILRSPYPAATIFAANRAEAPGGRIETSGPEDALITRPGLDVVIRHLPQGGAAFLQHLFAGGTLGEAAAEAQKESAAFDLPANIAGMLAAGVFTTICGAGR